jgi:hypothetical protein
LSGDFSWNFAEPDDEAAGLELLEHPANANTLSAAIAAMEITPDRRLRGVNSGFISLNSPLMDLPEWQN